MVQPPNPALVALNRFGLGARGRTSGDFAAASADPRGFLAAELARPGVALLEAPDLRPTPELARDMFDFQAQVKRQRELVAKPAADGPPAAPAMTAPDMTAPGTDTPAATPAPPREAAKPAPDVIQRTYRMEALARFQRASQSEAGIVERLVNFWSNHFCIGIGKGQPAHIWAGSFEREAIRPHVLGRFADMLRAVEQHPAMIFFLDNQQSIGPLSRAGQNLKRGLNENLAREIMELHTLGVGSGYTQEDVTALARIITGWTFVGREGRLGTPGTFVFNANAHEPGPQTLLGRVYPDTGLAQGEAALDDIARRPATAQFIARKFVRHFVADDPPPALVGHLADVFTRSDGDLQALTLALIGADEAWSTPLMKLRTPFEFSVAATHMLGRIPEEPMRMLGALALLGQPLWNPPGPNGFPDTVAAWASPESIKLRLDVSAQIAARIPDSIDARDCLLAVAGPAASEETRQALSRAQSRQQALALLLMAPEFQRR